MKSLVFLKENGKGNIYNENGAEGMAKKIVVRGEIRWVLLLVILWVSILFIPLLISILYFEFVTITVRGNW
jgi:hypothetical protein